MADVEVRDNTDLHHWEAIVDGQVAGFAQYRWDGDVVVFVHTEVDPAYEGQGIGSALVRTSLDALRKQGIKIVPLCPFYKSFIERHPEYADLVAATADE